MIYGVFSDVHSNLEALTQVLEFFQATKVDAYLCCGDLVGYGPQPNECLARIRRLKNLTAICGNHDLAAIGRMDLNWFNPYAREAVLWTREQLSQDERSFLEGLSAKIERSEFTLAHGSPRKPPEEYLLSVSQFRDNIPHVRAWPLFIGHSHMPLCFKVSEGPKGKIQAFFLEDQQEVELGRGQGQLPIAFNPGSVGQPRDQDSRASCALYDSKEGTFRMIRLPYDIPAVQAKIRKAGLPEFLALRLAFGR